MCVLLLLRFSGGYGGIFLLKMHSLIIVGDGGGDGKSMGSHNVGESIPESDPIIAKAEEWARSGNSDRTLFPELKETAVSKYACTAGVGCSWGSSC